MSDLRKLAEAATPGPWRAWFSNTLFRVQTSDQENCPLQAYVAKGSWWGENSSTRPGEQQAKVNAIYIAAASPDVVLGLLDERDEAREAVRRLAGALDDIGCGAATLPGYNMNDAIPTIVAALADPVVRRIVEGG